ncbi:hypothetical protein HY486_02180 [Candidatus Woesearchaeota archaeon]|nr:hypothetical protein [Candidatus Woesearchaeota archaeon]
MVYEIILGREPKERDKYGTKGCIFLAKQYVKMAQVTALAQSVWLDMNRAHVIFVCGKRGSGKCVTGDTLVTLENGEIIQIKELANRKEKILSLNHRLKITKAEKSEFFSRTVNEIVTVKLRSGKQITLTPEHPLLTISGWIATKDLTIGSRIATPRILPAFGNKPLPEHEIKILAYMMAEGHCKAPLFFTHQDYKIVQDLAEATNKFDESIILTRIAECGYNLNFKYEKRKIRKFLELHDVFGRLSGEKEIPRSIFTLPKHQTSLFLNRLFSCDGSICHSNNWEVSYATSSEKMARQIHHLLIRFGILSGIRTKNAKLRNKTFINYEIVLNGINVTKFLQEIGFFGRKQEIQQKALYELSQITHNPSVDTIPKEIFGGYRSKSWVAAGNELGYGSPKAARVSVDYAPSRQKLLTIAESDDNKRIKMLAQSDIFWDEITAIELKQETCEVYDITVPELHNFVANDIIIHNSYCMGVIAEGIVNLEPEFAKRLSVILLDTMGIYWTMKYPNHKDEALLHEWGLSGRGYESEVRIFTPAGYYEQYKKAGIPTDSVFAIKPSELTPEDWFISFDITATEPLGVFIERLILKMKDERQEYSIQDIINEIRIEEEEPHIKLAAENRFRSAQSWGLFDEKGTPIKELAKGGQITVLDLSCYATMAGGWRIKNLCMGIVCKRLFIERTIVRKYEEFASITQAVHYIQKDEEQKGEQMPIVWLMIDEAHEFLPREGKTAASDALITLLREGRQPGLAMVMVTQQPGKIHTDALTQSDIVLAHRITAKIDTDALGQLMQSYLRDSLDSELEKLPKTSGTCLAIDDVNERIFPMQIRPRSSWHGGSAPKIIEEKKNPFEF